VNLQDARCNNKDNLSYVLTPNIVLDPVTEIIVHFCIDFTSRLLKQI